MPEAFTLKPLKGNKEMKNTSIDSALFVEGALSLTD